MLFFQLQPTGSIKEHNSKFGGDKPLRQVICEEKHINKRLKM